ncbi:hypothetical protein SCLCIDRAFT_25389 [Scleroderma citrinum Foug A]|uniref:Uncharacterized protein n=1 Tax=Scleroderma citrinum Foug A TaxID=1036808 RepID=A0A0C3DMN2_9AGAM|nr:hypothetical protein SCLCIDRAFT_25389 [Scleroderma citrinum Foug A]
MVNASLDLELEVVSDRRYIAAESGFEEFQGDDMSMMMGMEDINKPTLPWTGLERTGQLSQSPSYS